MRYMGSKAKYAKHIIPILLEYSKDKTQYVEPFVGGGNLFSNVPLKNKWGNDTAKYSIALLSAIRDGWSPPDVLTEEEYLAIKSNPDNYEDALVGFAAYSCSYAGKYWGGYARGVNTKGEKRNFASEQKRNLEKQRKGLRGSKLTTLNYLEMSILDHSLVYCDPPYAGTTEYKDPFDSERFWAWCDYLVCEKNCNVFVSEYSAPPSWSCVWEKNVTSSLTKETGAKKAIERLFTKHKGVE